MNANLFARMEAGYEPTAVAVETAAGARLTYGDLFAMTARFANALRAHGVEPGDRVAVQVEKSAENLALYLATLRAGGVYLPLNTAYTPRELSYAFTDAEPKLIVCDPASDVAVAEVAGNVAVATLDAAGGGSLAEAAADMPDAFDTIPLSDDDLAAILYTSGTTGQPKGAMLTHRNLVANALTLVTAWQLAIDDVLIHALPIYHTHGLFVAANTMLLAAGKMLLLSKFDADAVVAAMPRATVLMGVPTFYTRLLAHPGLTHEAASHMRLFTSGSAPLLAETHRAFAERTGHAILERYGLTETGMDTSNPYDGARIPGTVGLPLPGVDVRIADAETGAVLPTGETGIVEVRGSNVFQGYWRMPDKTAAEFRPDGFFKTGDLGVIDGRGYLTIVGRAKDLIISGGLNVYPKEVEEAIDALPGVAESAVIGTPHADLGEGVVAVVVPAAAGATNEAAILAALVGELAGFKRPKRVIVVDELPRNVMGKVEKHVLRERFKDVLAARG